MLLRPFADSDGRLYFFDRRASCHGVMRSSPAKLFRERDLYIWEDSDGSRNDGVERALADLESSVAPTLARIVDSAIAGRPPALDVSQKLGLIAYMYYQWKRVPDVLERFIPDEEFRSLYAGAMDRYEADVGPLTNDERAEYMSAGTVGRIRHAATVMAVSGWNEDIVRGLLGKILSVVVIKRTSKSFIIGSNPVVKATYRGRSHLYDSSVEVWLPVSRNVAIALSGRGAGQERVLVLKDMAHIRWLNEAICRQSTTIAGCSQELVRSLSRPFRESRQRLRSSRAGGTAPVRVVAARARP